MGPTLGNCQGNVGSVTCVASRIKSWMIICSSLERHSLSLLIRVTVKASQFMDSSRLGQYTNSSSAFGNQENKLSYSVIKYLFLSFLANQPIMFAIFQTTQLTF